MKLTNELKLYRTSILGVNVILTTIVVFEVLVNNILILHMNDAKTVQFSNLLFIQTESEDSKMDDEVFTSESDNSISEATIRTMRNCSSNSSSHIASNAMCKQSSSSKFGSDLSLAGSEFSAGTATPKNNNNSANTAKMGNHVSLDVLKKSIKMYKMNKAILYLYCRF